MIRELYPLELLRTYGTAHEALSLRPVFQFKMIKHELAAFDRDAEKVGHFRKHQKSVFSIVYIKQKQVQMVYFLLFSRSELLGKPLMQIWHVSALNEQVGTRNVPYILRQAWVGV